MINFSTDDLITELRGRARTDRQNRLRAHLAQLGTEQPFSGRVLSRTVQGPAEQALHLPTVHEEDLDLIRGAFEQSPDWQVKHVAAVAFHLIQELRALQPMAARTDSRELWERATGPNERIRAALRRDQGLSWHQSRDLRAVLGLPADEQPAAGLPWTVLKNVTEGQVLPRYAPHELLFGPGVVTKQPVTQVHWSVFVLVIGTDPAEGPLTIRPELRATLEALRLSGWPLLSPQQITEVCRATVQMPLEPSALAKQLTEQWT